MSELGLILLVAVFVAFALVSDRLSRSPITGPMIFVAMGVVVGPRSLDAFDEPIGSEPIALLLELTLVVVLFTDAAAIDLRALRQESFVPGRLLGFGLPLTMGLGLVLALVFFGHLGFWEAAVLAVVLSPTDAALGQAVVTNNRVPRLVRQGLSVESGLNDGLAVPVLAVVLAAAQIEAGLTTEAELGRIFLEKIGIGILVGVALGWGGATAIVFFSRRGWMGTVWRGVSVTGLAVLAFAIAEPLGGSGFIAAFVGGLAFGKVIRAEFPDVAEHAEGVGYLLTMLSFFVFGALMLGPRLGELTGTVLLYALLSLTAARLLPVALAMIRSGLHSWTIVYMGWFGPRGLASLVFGVTMVLDSDLPGADFIVLVLTATVGLSVFAHGVTAWPGSARYADWYAGQADLRADMTESVHVEHIGVRRRVDPHWQRD